MRLFKSTLYAVRMEAPLDAGQAYRAWETTVATIVVGQWRAFTRVLVPRRLQLAHSFLAVEVRLPLHLSPHHTTACVSPDQRPCEHAGRPQAQTPNLSRGPETRGPSQARRRGWMLAGALVTWQLARPRRTQRDTRRFALVRPL